MGRLCSYCCGFDAGAGFFFADFFSFFAAGFFFAAFFPFFAADGFLPFPDCRHFMMCSASVSNSAVSWSNVCPAHTASRTRLQES